jgi:hypothetical protein
VGASGDAGSFVRLCRLCPVDVLMLCLCHRVWLVAGLPARHKACGSYLCRAVETVVGVGEVVHPFSSGHQCKLWSCETVGILFVCDNGRASIRSGLCMGRQGAAHPIVYEWGVTYPSV